mgnify:CR=1 FL=1
MNLTKIDRQILDSYASMIEGLSMYLGSVYEISLHSLEDHEWISLWTDSGSTFNRSGSQYVKKN